MLLARSAGKLNELVEEIGDSARAFAVDCSDREAVHAVAKQIGREVGTPDVIINNAGAGRWLFFDETDAHEFEQMMGAPFFAAVFTTRAFLPAMIERGRGVVVNVNTPIAFVPWQSATGYGAARWALRGLSELLRADLVDTGVSVVQVVPGLVSSGYLAHNPGVEEALPRIVRLIPTQTPEQVAAVILRAIEGERRLVFTPFMLRLLMAARHFAPGLLSWVVRQTGPQRTPVGSPDSAYPERGGT